MISSRPAAPHLKAAFITKNQRLILLAVVLCTGLLPGTKAQTAVDLKSAASFAVLGGSTVTNTGATVVTGDFGVSPGTAYTGFPPGVVVNGTIHAKDATADQAHVDLIAAYNAVTGQSVTNPGVAAFANTTLLPGVYNSTASISITGTVTLNGNGLANPVFVFQMGSTLLTGSSSQIVLTNGARAENVFWQVGTSATLDIGTGFSGTILAHDSITLNTGATLSGRALAMNGAVTLDTNAVTAPTAIPEPATHALIAALAALGAACWRRRRVAT